MSYGQSAPKMPAVAMGRAEQLQEFIRQNPSDPFPRYGLALEYKNAGSPEDAHAAFVELMTYVVLPQALYNGFLGAALVFALAWAESFHDKTS